MLPRNSPKGVRNLVKVVYVERPDLIKDYIQPGDLNTPELGPELLRDPIFRQSCANYGYAAIQIGDRLVRVYCKDLPHDTKIDPNAVQTNEQLGITSGNVQPDAYSSMPAGQDPRYEMSTQDNLERDRNRTKAILSMVYKHKLVGGKWVPTAGETPGITPSERERFAQSEVERVQAAQEKRRRAMGRWLEIQAVGRSSRKEEEDFISEHPIAKLGTSGPKGPHVTAMWFVKDDDAIYMFTSDVTQKVVNIKRDPRVSVLVDTYNPEDVGDVDSRMFYGDAELYEHGTPEWENGVRLILEKYKETRFEEDPEQKKWLSGEDPESKPLVIKISIAETVVPVDKGLNPDQERVPAGQPGGGQFAYIGRPKEPKEPRAEKFPPGMPTTPESKPYPPSIPNKQVYGSKPLETYKGVQIWGSQTLSATDKTLYTQAVKSGMDKLPDKMDHFVTRVVITDEKGPAFQAGGANHVEGGHFNPTTGEIVIRTTSAPSFWARSGIPHEFAHATWQDMDNKRDVFNTRWNDYAHNIAEDMKTKGYPWFGRPSQMKTGDPTGEFPEMVDPGKGLFNRETWKEDPMYGDRSINDYLTGPLDRERKMAFGRHGFSDVVRFSEASDKEGGVSEYARDHLKERHYTENFAEMTEQNLGRSYRDFDDPEKGITDYMLKNNKNLFPKTFASWRNLMLRYGWREPKESQ